MNHPSSPFGAYVGLLFGFIQTSTLLPGGANGVFRWSNSPNKYAQADSFIFTLAALRRFSVNTHCGNKRSYSCIGKFGSTVTNPALKWFLKVWIALSALFARWICGGTNWSSTPALSMACLRSLEISLSMTHVLG